MKIHLLLLIHCLCVSVGSLGLNKSGNGSMEGTELNSTSNKEIRKRSTRSADEIRAELALSAEEIRSIDERLKLLRKTILDHDPSLGDSIEEINWSEGVHLFQGDIVLTKSHEDKLLDGGTKNNNRLKRQAFRDWQYPNTVWRNNRVAFVFDARANQKGRSAFRKAAKLWREDTCLDIYEDTCALSPDRIRIVAEKGCWSHLGRIGDEQKLSLGARCESISTAAHELGHALGLYHTHSRHDRDQVVSVDIRNIEEEALNNFVAQKRTTNYNYGIPYDFGSIMHYGFTAFSSNGKPTMLPKDVLYTMTLGSPFISFYDLLMVNRHYNCTDICRQSKTICYLQGFPHPRDCSKCIFPGGYGGVECKERPAGCGQEFTAAPYPQVFHASVGNKSFGVVLREDFDKCHYWIKGPLNKRIEVKLLSFSPGGMETGGCKAGGVEIKTQKDQRLTGYRFCSKADANVTLISDFYIVPIITYNRIYETSVSIQYRYL